MFIVLIRKQIEGKVLLLLMQNGTERHQRYIYVECKLIEKNVENVTSSVIFTVNIGWIAFVLSNEKFGKY